jgi:putative DNA primase/helicase
MDNLLNQIQNVFATQLGSEITGFQFNDTMFRHKSLWAIGTAWDYKGNQYALVNYGDWKMGTKQTWKNFDPRQQSKQFLKKNKDNIQALQAIQKLEAEKKNEECRVKWKPKFDEASKGDLHPYLESKKLNENYTARVDHNGTLLIPAYDSNRFVGVQMIFESEGKFEKRFSTGIKLHGSFSYIGNIRNSDVVYVAEGFATGATIHQLTGHPVLIAFNCHNIYPAVKTLRTINQYCKLIICADNDDERINPQTGKKENIGIIKAKFTAHRISNCIVKIPKPDHGTDFNDWFQECEESTFDSLQFTSGDYVINLGRAGKKFYYFSTETKQVVDLSADQHSKNYFLTMADGGYWRDLYGEKHDKDGTPTGKPDWDAVQEKVLAKQRAIGFFNPKNIRGYGCWFDNGELVINLGNGLLRDNEITDKIKSKYLYESGDPLEIDLDNPLSNSEARKIPALFKKLNYKTKGDYLYLVAWIGQAQIFGALDWRFQAWLTGARGSGKTEILRMISNLVFRSEIYQSVTAASIRQHLRSNAVPMIIDEAEPNNPDERRRMDGVIELIRQCSSRLNTKTLRGTTNGTALEYNVNSVFLLSSIQTYLPTMADKSRFFEIEMADNKNQDSESWVKIQNEYAEISNYAPRLFARMVKLIPTIRENIVTTKRLLTKSELIMDKRAADQLAVAIAVYYAFYSEGCIDPQFIVDAAEALSLGRSNYENDNAEDEAEKCLNEIMESVIDRNSGKTIEAFLMQPGKNEILNGFGVKIVKGNLFIQTGNGELKRLLSNSMYSNLKSVLKRHPDYIGDGTALINKTKSGIFLKWNYGQSAE